MDYECRTGTAQHQLYADGAWPVLSRDPALDPLDTANRQYFRDELGSRLYYPELAAKAPTGMNPPKIDLYFATPLEDLASRENLNIVWMGTNILVEIIIDHSSYMTGWYLTNALNAAKLLVDLVPEHSAVGVIAYDNAVTTVYPIEEIVVSHWRNVIKEAIDGISTHSGVPAMGDACMEGLSQIQAYGHTNFTCVVWLLSSGKCNLLTGVSPDAAAAAYQTAQIPIWSFGFGPSEDYISDLLTMMANRTGGTYYYWIMPYIVADAFQDAYAAVSADQNLVSGTFTASGTAAQGAKAAAVSIPFQVDSTIADIKVTVSYSSADTVALNLTDPNGAVYSAVSDTASGTDHLLLFTVSAATAGQWTISGTAPGSSSLHYQVSGGVNGFSYYLTAVSMGGSTVAYPNPIQIVARLTRGKSIKGAVVKAVITDQQANTTTLTLSNTWGGTYAVNFMPSNGLYDIVVQADNSAGTAMYTWADTLPSPTDTGELPPVTPDAPVNEAFSRTTSLQVTMTGAEAASVPSAPSGVVATDGTCLDYVQVSWEPAGDASVYEVWRSADNSSANATKIGEIDRSFAKYMDSSVSVGARYSYWVKAANFLGTSDLSSPDTGWSIFGPAIRVNEATALALQPGNVVNVSVSMRTGSYAGYPCDWWLVAISDGGILAYMNSDFAWTLAGGLGDLRPVYTGGIFDIAPPITVFSYNALPPGTYRFYFALDLKANGILDLDALVLDSAVVTVAP